ncbi:hypothetical protein GOARA_012_00380 [Gordonia araii NBRC 100433]|uniref:DUF2867 domain-containing protein n=1 Tax=Gordonia araii NBRC 100433 TaxID=1073574 RepID=G7GY13_9ACTN|nr:hypothetical protein [Gordonia araii]NNG98099.1 hypothetical protein [Gordonia araii NBRC 100433]GAB08488.1 hypothetical protein GOARA_012_00380 [Gordonia araii NBRC 100433]
MGTIIIIVVLVAAALGLGGLFVLALLASGSTGPRRFRIDAPADLRAFLDHEAAWAVTAEVEVPVDVATAWRQVLNGPLIRLAPVYSGPTADGGTRAFRGIVAMTSTVVDTSGAQRMAAVGVGTSVPIVVKGIAEEAVVVARGRNRSIVTYTVAIEPRFVGFLPLRWTGVFVRPFLAFAIRRAF